MGHVTPKKIFKKRIGSRVKNKIIPNKVSKFTFVEVIPSPHNISFILACYRNAERLTRFENLNLIFLPF